MKPYCKKTTLLTVISLIITIFVTVSVTTTVFAEQSGSSPESGASSKIKETYDALVLSDSGSEAEGVWGNWGVMWNRIRSAAEWTPQAVAIESLVLSGKTFYADSRTLKTGTAQFSIDFSLQQYSDFDDYEGPLGNGEPEEEYGADEATWTNPSTNVWKDTRTGLYWSNRLGNYTNIFPDQDHSSCDFFATVPRGNYDGSDADCGNAINACATLELDANNDGVPETNWYLPTQSEAIQAYIDGMFNRVDYDFSDIMNGPYWTSTEVATTPTDAWNIYLFVGDTPFQPKNSSYPVRCVRRD